MDNGNEAQGIGARYGPGGIGVGMNNKAGEDSLPHIQYSMPGILHFLQTEWARFETERAQWEVERAELQARIAFLQGERKGQENLKRDLVRRIKMLEYALKKERVKFNHLKYGSDTQPAEAKEEPKEDDPLDVEPVVPSSGNTWRQGRQLLRQYLQEIGYTDTIIDVRNARVRTLLGLQPRPNDTEDPMKIMNGEKKSQEEEGRKTNVIGNRLAENVIAENEQSVLATFDFLAEHTAPDDEDKNSDEEDEGGIGKTEEKDITVTDEDTEEALAEFDFLVAESGEGATDSQSLNAGGKGSDGEWGMNQQQLTRMKEQYQQERKGKKNMQRPSRSTMENLLQSLKRETGGTDGKEEGVEDEALEAALGLGDLASLTVKNEAESSYETSTKDIVRTWTAKYTLRSHFDGIRDVAFHPVEPVLISASEDNTLKLWNLTKPLPSKKSAAVLDVEPLYTFRGHVGPVLSVAVDATGEQCYSSGLDGTVRVWNLRTSDDPYDAYDPTVVGGVFREHTEAVWSVAVHTARMQLLSCSADGTMKLWATQLPQEPLLSSFSVDEDAGVPTCAEFLVSEPNNIIASYTSGNTYLIDSETGATVTKFEVASDGGVENSSQVNAVLSHPTLPLAITAHEDKHIRFHDVQSGKTVHSMVAHLDSVTSLAVDPNGLYLLSGSHDCSIRLWDMDSKSCVQEITAHRKKLDESIHTVAFHPAKPYIASAGADALCKVFV